MKRGKENPDPNREEAHVTTGRDQSDTATNQETEIWGSQRKLGRGEKEFFPEP